MNIFSTPRRPGSARSIDSPTVASGAQRAMRALLESCHSHISDAVLPHVQNVHFTSSSSSRDMVLFPCPLKEQEAVAAIKALEACLAAAIADLRYGRRDRQIEVNTDRVACFLMSAYVSTIDGMDKSHPGVKDKIPDTDLNKAQSILYRRLSANLYETRTKGEYYHIHGSLEASKTLEMIGLPAFNPSLTDYRECIDTIEVAVRKYTVAELERLNQQERQAGIPALTQEQFLGTPHGKALARLPPFTLDALETHTPRVPFTTSNPSPPGGTTPQCLQGIKVLELCRVIAGPTIGRSLAAHGALVLKVTAPHLPDVPFFQLEVNTGKHAAALDLTSPPGRRVFAALLADADVLLDGYRPGALARMGFGPAHLAQVARARGRGFVYVAEDCFGGGSGGGSAPAAEWAHRPGWQQIADCATGVAWAQGAWMGLSEPVVPPFPMSDYGTGALGGLAALAGLHRRAVRGGSWAARTSLCQYDVFLLGLGGYPAEVQERARRVHEGDFFALRHSDSVDEVGRRAMRSMRRAYPHLFDAGLMMHTAWSRGFKGEVRWPREAVSVKGLRVGHVRTSRPNGFDAPSWDGWEVEDEVVEDQ